MPARYLNNPFLTAQSALVSLFWFRAPPSAKPARQNLQSFRHHGGPQRHRHGGPPGIECLG